MEEKYLEILTQTVERSKSNTHQIDEIKSDIKEIREESKALNQLATSVELIAKDMTVFKDDVSSFKSDVAEIKVAQSEMKDEIADVKNEAIRKRRVGLIALVSLLLQLSVLAYLLSCLAICSQTFLENKYIVLEVTSFGYNHLCYVTKLY